jgi:hypothetical protein
MHCDKAFGYTHLPMEHNSGESLDEAAARAFAVIAAGH